MEDDKLKNRINALYKIIVEGDLNLRMNYIARLLDHLQIFIDRKALSESITPETKEEIIQLEQARENYSNALDPWSKYLANNPAGLAKATIHSDQAIQIITKVIENNNLNTASTWQFRHFAAEPKKPQEPAEQLPSDIFKNGKNGDT
jgi:hypothetical protein